MGDPVTRKSVVMDRLRKNLKKKRESLADQFDFKMYIVFQFKDEKKKSAMFEVDEVMAVMTNNYQLSILRGVRNDSYSYESSKELMSKDIVQFHAHKWQPMRRDVIGCKTLVDFFLWPRNDIESIQCYLFSKWKGEDEPFRLLDATYTLQSDEYERHLMRLLPTKDKEGLIVANGEQTLFLFVDKQQMQTAKNKVTLFKLQSVCVYIPQDRLMMWKPGSIEDLMAGQFL